MKDKDDNAGWFGTGMSDDSELLTVTIVAQSKRGKQLIKRLGDQWWVCRFDESLPCFDGKGGVLIAPKGRAWHSHTSRWVRASGWLKWQDPNVAIAAQSLLDNIELARFQPAGA